MKSVNILIINGPNLNLLGTREVEVYGSKSYQDLKRYLKNIAKDNNVKVKIVQTNSEGKIINYLQKSKKYQGIILNAGAYTHYSYAIRDAIMAINVSTVEVHLSNIMTREDFRKTSVITDVCLATFYGQGFKGYELALKKLMEAL